MSVYFGLALFIMHLIGFETTFGMWLFVSVLTICEAFEPKGEKE